MLEVDTLLEVSELRTYFRTPEGILPAVDNVSFTIGRGETLAVVGESGCGKSVTALSILRLVQTPPGMYKSGRILFEGEDLLRKPEAEMRKIRGNRISMIFQEPMTSLNPVHTVGDQIAEAVELHQGVDRKTAMARAEEMLWKAGVPDPGARVNEYPHRLSGGMRQRVMIAMALSCRPRLLIADEPTTALDVTIQAQILELMKGLKKDADMSIMLITHDLGVVAEMADRVVVMYAGKVVEEAPALDIFQDPHHPYTEGLCRCVPRVDRPRGDLYAVEGVVPDPLRFPEGCRFHPRCPRAQAICSVEQPALNGAENHKVACHFALGGASKGVASVGS